jgi:hypothetical protein
VVPLVMVGLFGAYVLLHSPARPVLARLLGMETSGCYFCLGNYAAGQLVDPLAALVLIVLGLLAGWILADRVEGPAYERLLTVGLLAATWITVPAAAVGAVAYWWGLPLLRPPLGPLLASVPSAGVVIVGLAAGWRPRWPSPRLGRPPGLVLLVDSLALVLLSVSVVVYLSHPPTSGDAVSYHAPLAVFLWQEGNLGTFLDRAPDVWALAQPGTAELWYGLLRLLGGESLADLGQLPFALLGSAAAAAFCRRLGFGHGSALLAAGAFLLVPMTAMQVGTQPNDVVAAALLMSTMALASAPARGWTTGRLIILGLGMGLVAVTKLGLLPCVAAVGVFLTGSLLRRGARAAELARLGWVLLPFLVVVAPWWMRNAVQYGNPLYPAALPLLGRGVFLGDLGRVDISFVPSPLAWPLYPLLEAHDDRSGFGTLAVVGMIPGFVLAVRHRFRPAVVLWTVAFVCMLPAWWVFTLHEPRFLLGLVGLGFGFLPCALLAVPRRQRQMAAATLGVAAIFSTLVTIDQAVLPIAVQPTDRLAFYDRVWGVDPAVAALPENEGLLHNLGYAPPTIPEYAAYYPLLGPSLSRLVVPVEEDPSTDVIVARMRAANVRYAYVLTSPQNRRVVDATYTPALFELVHMSTIVAGESSGARRHLYRLASPAEEPSGTARLLFRLRQ